MGGGVGSCGGAGGGSAGLEGDGLGVGRVEGVCCFMDVSWIVVRVKIRLDLSL